ncbi:Spy/CpxP family protein refolding chaperone [Psychromonas sp. KJ10-10]|uniref:Spy/CpxP family protein refolding chaperone n=1 Tax=Psychromonas sp. KJ10-10 TaxID=3391823 RepID=UPI0039B64077
MENKTISAIILATTLSFAGASYAVADNQQGMKNNQNCVNQSEQMKDNQNCNKQAGEMKKKHGDKHKFAKKGKGKHNGKHQGKRNQKMAFAKLDLSAEQKQQINEIMSAVKTEKQNARLAYRASMQVLMVNETFDVDAAKSLMTAQQAQKEESRLAMMKAKHQAFQLLTDEQKAKYNELKEKGKKRHKR